MTASAGKNGRTALVTGGNRGLGRETSRQLGELGFHVILTSRNGDDGKSAAAELAGEGHSVEALTLDVAAPGTITAAADRLARTAAKIDVLVNNAGISLDGFNEEVARRTVDVNFFGPLRVTDALLPFIPAGGAIVMVSSGMGELAGVDPKLRARFTAPALDRDALVDLMKEFVSDVAAGKHRERGWPSSAYRVSKVGLNALVRVLSPELAKRHVIINAVCPGWVRTDMGGRAASRSVSEGAASIVWAATREAGPTGGFFRDGRSIPW
jgi:NAD(P)-dependent dehydrogenase (short-subunit alcohol dehydrogenase family)